MTTLVVARPDDPTSSLAIETALAVRNGEVVVAAIGTSATEPVLRQAIAAGADHGIRVDLPDRDVTSGVEDAFVLAELVEQLRPDIVLVGARRGKLGTYGAGPALAELTGLPHIGSVSRAQRIGDQMRVERRRESDLETVVCTLPAVLSVEWGPPLRYPTLPGRLRARRADVRVVEAGSTPKPSAEGLRRTGPKPRRKLEQRRGPGFDHVLGMLLGGASGGGGGRRLAGDLDDLAVQIVKVCTEVLEGA